MGNPASKLIEKCICLDIGYDGTADHTSRMTTVQVTRKYPEGGSVVIRELRICSNHVDNYRRAKSKKYIIVE